MTSLCKVRLGVCIGRPERVSAIEAGLRRGLLQSRKQPRVFECKSLNKWRAIPVLGGIAVAPARPRIPRPALDVLRKCLAGALSFGFMEALQIKRDFDAINANLGTRINRLLLLVTSPRISAQPTVPSLPRS